MHDLEAFLTRARSAWMAGRSALEYCPAEWRGAMEGEDAECALAALTGHATAVLFRPAPAAPLDPRPLLPSLALPTLPEHVRPRLRRAMAAQKAGASLERALIDLVTARGFAVHPADWMPSPRDDWAPDLYAPWLDWVRAEDKPTPDTAFKLETYGQWPWAERRVALAALRESDPGAARAIIAAKASAEPAERRIKLIEILETKLSQDDGEFLDSLANDRSDRVQALARAYLARLGRHAETGALAAELAEMLETGKVGLVQRRTQLVIKTLKAATQSARRRDLFTQVNLADLAGALGVSEHRLVETTPSGTAEGIEAFVQMVAATGSDDARHMLLDRMLDDADFSLAYARPLGPRLSTHERRAILPRIMERDSDMFVTSLALMGRTLGEAPLSALLASPGYAALTSGVEAALRGDEAQRSQAAKSLEATLNRIALLIDAAAAAELMTRLTASDLSPADPKLDMLHLNAALVPETTP
jgi:uncharacterized protein DUF5691